MAERRIICEQGPNLERRWRVVTGDQITVFSTCEVAADMIGLLHDEIARLCRERDGYRRMLLELCTNYGGEEYAKQIVSKAVTDE